jgi:hypothetical protein
MVLTTRSRRVTRIRRGVIALRHSLRLPRAASSIDSPTAGRRRLDRQVYSCERRGTGSCCKKTEREQSGNVRCERRISYRCGGEDGGGVDRPANHAPLPRCRRLGRRVEETGRSLQSDGEIDGRDIRKRPPPDTNRVGGPFGDVNVSVLGDRDADGRSPRWPVLRESWGVPTRRGAGR